MSSSLVCFNPNCKVKIKPENEVFFHLHNDGSFRFDHLFCNLECLPKEGTCNICQLDVCKIRFKKGKVEKSTINDTKKQSSPEPSLRKEDHFILQVEPDNDDATPLGGEKDPRVKICAFSVVIIACLIVIIWSSNKYLV